MKYNYTLLGLIIFFSSCETKVEKNSKPPLSKPLVSTVEGNYELNITKSALTWIGKEITTKTHTGTIDIKKGNIRINSDKSVTGEVFLVMNTLKVTDLEGKSKEYLEGHLNEFQLCENLENLAKMSHLHMRPQAPSAEKAALLHRCDLLHR